MTDKSVFSDDEWNALRDAPALVEFAGLAAGEHGPISLVKEASASARAIARPGDRGAANALIAEIVEEANSKEVRHDVKGHKRATIEATIEAVLTALQPAAAALAKLPPDEAVQIGAWFVDIAKAEAEAAKSVNPTEQAMIDKIAALFNVTST
jgi:hypothetical protein